MRAPEFHEGDRSKFMSNHDRTDSLVLIIVAAAAIILVYGCAPEPAPSYAPAPSTFDRAWSAAVGAAQDEGVRINSQDRASGTISGPEASRRSPSTPGRRRTETCASNLVFAALREPTRDWPVVSPGLMTGGWDDRNEAHRAGVG